MLDLYIIKHGSDGAGDDGPDEISDVDNEIDTIDEESGDNGGMVGSKEGNNDLNTVINGDTKGLEEVKELVRSDPSSSTTNNVEYKVTENGDLPTTTKTTT